MEDTITRVEQTYDSIKNLLENLGTEERSKFHRQSIIDSFLISQFRVECSKVYNDHKQNIINNEIANYNKKLGQMYKLNYDIEKITQEFESKQKQIKLPDLRVSLTTIKDFDVTLYEKIIKDGYTEQQVNIKDIFRLDGDDLLDYDKFKAIVNIEYKKRMERIIKYEILLKIKRDVNSINNQWGVRNQDLDKFINKDVKAIMKRIEEIRNIEFEVDDEEEDEEDLGNESVNDALGRQEHEQQEEGQDFLEGVDVDVADNLEINVLESDKETMESNKDILEPVEGRFESDNEMLETDKHTLQSQVPIDNEDIEDIEMDT